MELINSSTLYSLFRHGLQWLGNLRRAKRARLEESVEALRQVITAARETAVYLRQVKEAGKPDHSVERHLTILWTRLGFTLQDLGIMKLAKRCQVTGMRWADPSRFDKDFLDKADVSLERMERLARAILAEIEP